MDVEVRVGSVVYREECCVGVCMEHTRDGMGGA